MLKIQEFIFNHSKNWHELLLSPPYCLRISKEGSYVLLKYNQISSDFNEEICREARGIILDSSDNFKVVRMAFRKFFNLGESFADEMDWDTCVAMEKIDGSLMSVWFANGEWHLSTNGSLNAFKTELPYGVAHKTFGELFESILPLSFFYNKGLENYCFTFELCSLENKVVLSSNLTDKSSAFTPIESIGVVVILRFLKSTFKGICSFTRFCTIGLYLFKSTTFGSINKNDKYAISTTEPTNIPNIFKNCFIIFSLINLETLYYKIFFISTYNKKDHFSMVCLKLLFFGLLVILVWFGLIKHFLILQRNS